MTQEYQSFLLSDSAMQAASYSTYENFKPSLGLNISEIKRWKQRIVHFQSHLSPVEQQGSLFDLTPQPASSPPVNASSQSSNSLDAAETLDPFSLQRQNTEFWRWQFDDVGTAAMYFVIDYASTPASNPLLLYIGETVKSNQRWKGVHDCKRYLQNYRQAHYDHGLASEVGIAFWTDAPSDRKARQTLESALIHRWRSPFNKENWRFWNTPFVDGKAPE